MTFPFTVAPMLQTPESSAALNDDCQPAPRIQPEAEEMLFGPMGVIVGAVLSIATSVIPRTARMLLGSPQVLAAHVVCQPKYRLGPT
jgi:hypothetical protein